MADAQRKRVEQGVELSPRPSFPTKSAGNGQRYQLGEHPIKFEYNTSIYLLAIDNDYNCDKYLCLLILSS